MADSSARRDDPSPILETLIALARVIDRIEREAVERRAKLRVVKGRRDAA